jgi:hypothetical protein
MFRWEYLTLHRERGWAPHGKDRFARGTDWTNILGYRGGDTQWPGTLQDILDRLGVDGWELVSVSPRSSVLGTSTDRVDESDDYAGFTTSEIWAFKRPLP